MVSQFPVVSKPCLAFTANNQGRSLFSLGFSIWSLTNPLRSSYKHKQEPFTHLLENRQRPNRSSASTSQKRFGNF
jgi:hypothetical protein